MPAESQNIDLSVVIPCFRGEQTLLRLCERIRSVLAQAVPKYEIILVDDSDRESLWNLICDLGTQFPEVRGVRLNRNFGQHNATVTGFRESRGKYVASLDEDLQNPPEEIPRLLATLKTNSLDAVYGTPAMRRGPRWRGIASRIVMSVPRRVMGLSFDISAFRLMTGAIARQVATSDRHDIILDINISWLTRRIGSVEIEHHASELTSSYSFVSLVSIFIDLICNYTVMPLRLISAIGFVVSLLALVAAAIIFVSRLQNYITVPGWASVIVAIFVGTGLMLLAIGVVSEYLARIFLRINAKPQTFIRSTTDS